MTDLLLAIDQGTTSTKAMLVDRKGRVLSEAAVGIGQNHPQPGWVEQDAVEIWQSVQDSVRQSLSRATVADVVGVALSVQRESVLLWDRQTRQPLGPVLSWQDQRTAAMADLIESRGSARHIQDVTGLPLDPMFSALKAGWLLDQFDKDRRRSRAGELCVGTMDAWLLTCLGADEPIVEMGNASRTQLLSLATGDWDESLLAIFDVPREVLPTVVPSTGPFPHASGLGLAGDTPVLAVMADSHAALFAHAGWRPGVMKATYGTGSSVMALGVRPAPDSGLCETIAWAIGEPSYALEANIRSTGRTMSWLADLLEVDVELLWQEAAQHESAGVFVVPAFGGLGAPYWEREAVPTISGFSLGTQRGNIARAVLESITHQVDDVLQAFEEATGPVRQLMCDGGMTQSQPLMQLQSDISGTPVHLAPTTNLSALGAAYLAGVVLGWWTQEDMPDQPQDGAEAETIKQPSISDRERALRRAHWDDAIQRSRTRREAPRAEGVE